MSPTAVLATTSTHLASVPSIGASAFKMLFALLIVVAVIYGCAKVLGRMRGVPSGRTTSTPGLSIVARHSVGKGLQLAVVRWGTRELLVGIAGQTMTLLHDGRAPTGATSAEPVTDELEAEPVATSGVALPATAPTGASSILELLRSATERR